MNESRCEMYVNETRTHQLGTKKEHKGVTIILDITRFPAPSLCNLNHWPTL